MSHVFISYSSKNIDYAQNLANTLTQLGFDIWIDNRKLQSGDDWWRAIVQALSTCSSFVVILTPESDASKWVQREITLADNWNKPMFPLLLAGDINTENFLIFVRTQYEDVRNGQLPPERFYQRLAQSTPRKSAPGTVIQNTATNAYDPQLATAMQSPPEQPYYFSPVGTWNAQIQNTYNGVYGSGTYIFAPNGAFSARLSNPMGTFDAQGQWNLYGNQMGLQGMQWPVMWPANQMPYMTVLHINDASPVLFRGSTAGGEVFVCQRVS